MDKAGGSEMDNINNFIVPAMRRKIRKEIKVGDLYDILCSIENLEDAIKKIKEHTNGAAGYSIFIKEGDSDYYDCKYAEDELYVEAWRLETDEEYNTRIKKEEISLEKNRLRNRLKRREQKEKFNKLHEKYHNEEFLTLEEFEEYRKLLKKFGWEIV